MTNENKIDAYSYNLGVKTALQEAARTITENYQKCITYRMCEIAMLEDKLKRMDLKEMQTKQLLVIIEDIEKEPRSMKYYLKDYSLEDYKQELTTRQDFQSAQEEYSKEPVHYYIIKRYFDKD